MSFSASSLGVKAMDPATKKTLTNTFITVGVMQVIAAASCWLAMALLPPFGVVGSLVALVLMIVVLVLIHVFKNSALGLVMLAVFAIISGSSLSPLLTSYLSSPGMTSVLYETLALTAAASFGAAGYAISTRKDFSFMGGALFAGLIVLLVASLLGMFFSSPLLHLAIGVGGSILFLLYLLYDVSRIVNRHETNYVTAAVDVYLDILNLFLSLLRLRD